MAHQITASLLLAVVCLTMVPGGDSETDRASGNRRPRPMAPNDPNGVGQDPNLVPYHVVGGVSPAGEQCNKMAGDCRLMTMRDRDTQETHFEVSCYCYMREEDVTGNLDDLMKRPCPLVPKDGQMVDYAVLNITKCFVERQTVPMELIAAMRRSRHLTIVVDGARNVRFPHPQTDLLGAALDSIDVTITNSAVSGIGRGLVSGATRLRLEAVDGDLGIIGTDAFTHYDHPNADVIISLNHTNVTKFTKDSVRLPTTGSLTVFATRVSSIDGGAISGEGEIAFRGSPIGAIHRGAVNIAHLSKFEVFNCTIATVDDSAVVSHSDEPDSNDNGDIPYLSEDQADRRSYAVPEPSSHCHVIVAACRILGTASTAFTEICKAAQVTWESNVILDTFGGPLLLESPDCPLPPSSILSTSVIKCTNCSLFDHITSQMCPVYSLATCTICHDGWCSKTLDEFISEECPEGDTILHSLNTTCHGKKRPRKLHFSSGATGQHVRTLESLAGVMLVSFVIFVTPRA